MSSNIPNHRGSPERPIFKSIIGVCIVFVLDGGWAIADPVQPAASDGFPADGKTRAESATPLTLQQAIERALADNPDLTIAQREIEANDGLVMQSHVRPNPELAYALEDTRRETRSQSLQLNLPLELGGQRAARISAAERGRDIAVAELSARRMDIRASVVAAFFDVLSAQELAALAQRSMELAQRATDAAAKRVLAGKVSPVEETKARVAEAGVRVEVVQAQSALRNARQRLAYLWGETTPRFSRVDGRMDAPPHMPSLESVEQRAGQAPTLKRAQLELARRQSLVDVERSKRVPDVTLSVGVKRDEALQRNQVLFGVSVPLPLFDRNQGGLLEAVKREDKARDELQVVQVRLIHEALQSREHLNSLNGEIDLLQRDVLPRAQSAYDAAVIGFENGKFSFLEVLDAQRTYFQAKSQYLKALAEAHGAAAAIDRLLGEPTTAPQLSMPKE